MLRNKRGQVMVEASLVIPVVILVIATLLSLLIFFYSCLSDQISLHKNILSKLNDYDKTAETAMENRETHVETKGIIINILGKEQSARALYIRESSFIRAGDKAAELL